MSRQVTVIPAIKRKEVNIISPTIAKKRVGICEVSPPAKNSLQAMRRRWIIIQIHYKQAGMEICRYLYRRRHV